jgi:hypothetical protein
MESLTYLPVRTRFSENWLCIRPIRYSRNAADRNSKTSKPVDMISISDGCGNRDERALSLVNRSVFSDDLTLPFGNLDVQPVNSTNNISLTTT